MKPCIRTLWGLLGNVNMRSAVAVIERPSATNNLTATKISRKLVGSKGMRLLGVNAPDHPSRQATF